MKECNNVNSISLDKITIYLNTQIRLFLCFKRINGVSQAAYSYKDDCLK